MLALYCLNPLDSAVSVTLGTLLSLSARQFPHL